MIVIHEGLPEGVDGLEAQGSGIQSVDTLLGAAAGMGCLAFIDDILGHTAVGALTAGEGTLLPDAGMEHKGNIAAIHVAPVHEFHLAAQVMDDTLVPERITEADFNELFGGNRHQTDGTAETIQGAGLLQSQGDTHQACTLGVMTAGVGAAIPGFGMGGSHQSVQFAQDQDLGAGLAGVDIGVEAGDISCVGQGVASLFKNLGQVSAGIPLFEAGFRMLPNVALHFQDLLCVLADKVQISLFFHNCLL